MKGLSTRRSVIEGVCAAPLLLTSARARAQVMPVQATSVRAPFQMPGILVPDFRNSRRFQITDFGAKPGDKRGTSAAIARAIHAANAAGSGSVIVPAGIWLTGKIHLKSNVNLHLARGAILRFSDDPQDYFPAVQTSWEGIECFNYSPLIYAFGCENVAISGPGRIEPVLDRWKIWSARPKPHMDALVALYDMAYRKVPVAARQMAVGENNLRPHLIQFNRCRNVLVEDISIQGSPFWTLHPLLCRDVTIRRVSIQAHGHNNDGVDPEMSQNVLIEDCVFDQGDDAVSVKSGRDMDAWRLATPCRNVVVRNCRVLNCHQLMAVGSELSGGIENIWVDDCHFVGDGRGSDDHAVLINNLLYVKTNERRGGYVRNVHMSRVTATTLAGSVLAVETDVLYQWRTLLQTYVRRLTAIERLRVSDVHVQQARSIAVIKGEKDLPIRDVRLSRVHVERVSGTPMIVEHARDITLPEA